MTAATRAIPLETARAAKIEAYSGADMDSATIKAIAPKTAPMARTTIATLSRNRTNALIPSSALIGNAFPPIGPKFSRS